MQIKHLPSTTLIVFISVILFAFTSQKLEAQTWMPVDNGTNPAGSIFGFATYSGNLYAGGEYDTAGGIAITSNCGAYNGTNWINTGNETFFSQVAGYMYALADYSDHLYAGGQLDTSYKGGYYLGAIALAKWNGANWSEYDSDIYFESRSVGNALYIPFISSLAVFNGNLYVGGEFGSAAGVAASCIAEWNGTSCSAVGTGINGYGEIDGLIADNTYLYAGGGFDTINGKPANNVASWNGTTWSALGSGVNGRVNALALYNSYLYVAGDFDSAGGKPASGIAEWNGTNWSALTSGVSGVNNSKVIEALIVDNAGNLYAGGVFDTVGDIPAKDVAKWNGTNWSAMGSGINNVVYALGIYNGNLYAGGSFDTASGKPAYNIAEWGLSSGINQLSINRDQPTIYPNPGSGLFIITSAKEVDEIKVTNVLGQVVYHAEPKQAQFNFELKEEGMYFVTTIVGDESVTTKVIVTH